MRKIDADAFNKKILDKIEELDLMVKKINPENIKYFDAELIEAAKTYVETIKDCSWSGSSNFNGIEMHKVKDMLSYLENRKANFIVDNVVISGEYNLNVAEAMFNYTVNVNPLFDGRKSFVVPRFLGFDKDVTPQIAYFNPMIEGAHTSAQSRSKLDITKTRSAIKIKGIFPAFDFKKNYKLYMQIFYILWR